MKFKVGDIIQFECDSFGKCIGEITELMSIQSMMKVYASYDEEDGEDCECQMIKIGAEPNWLDENAQLACESAIETYKQKLHEFELINIIET